MKLCLNDIVLLAFLGYSMGGSTSSSHLYISTGLLGLWGVCAFFTAPRAFQAAFMDRKIFWLILYLLYAFLTGLFVGEFIFEIKQFVAGLYLYSPILILNYYIKKDELDIRRLSTIVFCILAILLFYSYKAIVFYGQHASAARYLAMDKETYGDIAIGGGYSLAYGSAILSILLFSLLIEGRIESIIKKLLAIGMILIGTLVVFATQSTVAVICWAISFVIAIVLRDKREKRGSFTVIKSFVAMLWATITFFFIRYIGQFVMWIASTQEGMFANRLGEIGDVLIGEEAFGRGYLFDRFKIPFESIGTFFTHPLLGVSYEHGNNFLDSSLFGVGQHGEWADALANYGFIFGTCFIAIYVREIKEVQRYNMGISQAWWICLILIGMFNPVRTFNANVIVFLIVPLIAIINRRSKMTPQSNDRFE